MGILTINGDLCENGCNLEFSPSLKDLFLVLTIFLIDIFVVFSISKQREKRIIQHKSGHELKLYKHDIDMLKPIEVKSEINILNDLWLFSAEKSCMVSIHTVDFSVLPSIESNNEILLSIDERKLICYVDGSYSHRMQIGHSGFRASDGSSAVQCYSPQCPKRGSTGSEVFAASLAIQHALENCFNALIIRTDNSKVEQLLCRPKDKDNNEYPDFCQTLNQYRQQNGKHAIRVERVRGHTTRSEQKRCKIKQEFARIDRLVRKTNRQYIKRWQIQYAQFYTYFYQYNYYFYYKWTVYRCFNQYFKQY